MNLFSKLSKQELSKLSGKELKDIGPQIGVKVYGKKSEMIDKILKGYENVEKASLEAQQNEIEETEEIKKLLTQESDASFDGHLQLNDDDEFNSYNEALEAMISDNMSFERYRYTTEGRF